MRKFRQIGRWNFILYSCYRNLVRIQFFFLKLKKLWTWPSIHNTGLRKAGIFKPAVDKKNRLKQFFNILLAKAITIILFLYLVANEWLLSTIHITAKEQQKGQKNEKKKEKKSNQWPSTMNLTITKKRHSRCQLPLAKLPAACHWYYQ